MNKVALITGGSRGLGKSMAEHLAAQQVDVILTYQHQAEKAQQSVAILHSQGVKAAALPLSFAQQHHVVQFATEVKQLLHTQWQRTHIDFLVNNAGHGLHKPFAEITEAEFDALMNVHFKGVFFLTQQLAPLLADGGRIVNISSGLARFTLPGMSAYAAMKGAVEVLTRYLAKELAERRITVNTVAPGAIATDFGDGAVRDNTQMNQMVASLTALGRAGEAEDIGGAVAALLSEQNRWVNGQRIEVSGGMFL